jgi:hypothetical protein
METNQFFILTIEKHAHLLWHNCYSGSRYSRRFMRTPIFGRVKQRSFDLRLLIKLHGRISRMQLSSGFSHCRRWIHSVMKKEKPVFFISVSIGLGFQQLFHHLHLFHQIAFLSTLFNNYPSGSLFSD